ncbi:MAG: recombinase family protein [Sporomusa sp.]|nr:recombinase family protein [Sporomusa sp.]
MTVYACLARTSFEDQAERGTIENQIEFAIKYADLHQNPITYWYKDDGISGTLPLESRPEDSKMLQDAKSTFFDVLLVYKLDRLGRSARVVLNAVYELVNISFVRSGCSVVR